MNCTKRSSWLFEVPYWQELANFGHQNLPQRFSPCNLELKIDSADKWAADKANEVPAVNIFSNRGVNLIPGRFNSLDHNLLSNKYRKGSILKGSFLSIAMFGCGSQKSIADVPIQTYRESRCWLEVSECAYHRPGTSLACIQVNYLDEVQLSGSEQSREPPLWNCNNNFTASIVFFPLLPATSQLNHNHGHIRTSYRFRQ